MKYLIGLLLFILPQHLLGQKHINYDFSNLVFENGQTNAFYLFPNHLEKAPALSKKYCLEIFNHDQRIKFKSNFKNKIEASDHNYNEVCFNRISREELISQFSSGIWKLNEASAHENKPFFIFSEGGLAYEILYDKNSEKHTLIEIHKPVSITFNHDVNLLLYSKNKLVGFSYDSGLKLYSTDGELTSMTIKENTIPNIASFDLLTNDSIKLDTNIIQDTNLNYNAKSLVFKKYQILFKTKIDSKHQEENIFSLNFFSSLYLKTFINYFEKNDQDDYAENESIISLENHQKHNKLSLEKELENSIFIIDDGKYRPYCLEHIEGFNFAKYYYSKRDGEINMQNYVSFEYLDFLQSGPLLRSADVLIIPFKDSTVAHALNIDSQLGIFNRTKERPHIITTKIKTLDYVYSTSKYKLVRKGRQYGITDETQQTWLLAPKFDSIQMGNDYVLAFKDSNKTLFNKRLEKININSKKLADISMTGFPTQCIYKNEIGWIANNKLQKQRPTRFNAGCGTGIPEYDRKIIRRKDQFIWQKLLVKKTYNKDLQHYDFDTIIKNEFVFPETINDVYFLNGDKNLKSQLYRQPRAQSNMVMNDDLIILHMEDSIQIAEINYNYINELNFKIITTLNAQQINCYGYKHPLLFLKDGLLGYYPLHKNAEYLKLDLFNGAYSRFEKTDGTTGWLDQYGNEFIDQ